MENTENFEVAKDLRQSPEYGKYMEQIGWKTIPVGKDQMFIRKLGPVAVAKLQRTKGNIFLKEIEDIAEANRVMMIKIEPLKGGKPPGYRLSNWPLLGTKTLRVSLKPSEEEIFNSFKKDARYELRKMVSRRWTIEKNNFSNFYKIWKMSARRKSLWIPKEKEYRNLIEAFGKNVFCLAVKDLAGVVILIHNKAAFYYYAGSTLEGMRLNLPYLMVWEAMREAKKRGCKIWDFEGIYDFRWPNKNWLGFSHFKRSFGGKEIEFPGSFEKWRWPF